MLVGVVPEVPDHKGILRQVLIERVEHGVGSRQLPVGLQLTGQGEGGDQLGPRVAHARHGGFRLVAVPGPAGVHDREHLVAVVEHGERREGTAGADRHGGDDDVPAARAFHDALQRLAEGWVLVAVDDASAPVDRLVGEEFLDLGQRIAVLPLGVGRGDEGRDVECLGGARQTDHVALVLGQGHEVTHADHEADLVIDQQHDAVVRRGLVVGVAASFAGLVGGGFVG